MENTNTKKDIQRPFQVGDIVKVTTRDFKDKKVHPAAFEGVVISVRGEGDSKTFTVRKIGANQIAIERIFPINSPYIANVQKVKQTRVRRAKLTYLRKKRSLL